jgi:hypothetical protein
MNDIARSVNLHRDHYASVRFFTPSDCVKTLSEPFD